MWSRLLRVGAGGATALAYVRPLQMEASFDSHKEQMIIGYEDRIRKFSTPEKNFSVFATANAGGELYMTPFDFVKSLMHYDEAARDQINARPPTCFTLLDADGNGLLSFIEYMLLLTLLTVSKRDASTLFDILDKDRSGYLEQQEFDNLVETLQSSPNDTAGRRAPGSQRGAPRAMYISQKGEGNISELGNHKIGNVSMKHYGATSYGMSGGKMSKLEFLKLLDSVHRSVLLLEFEAHGGSSKGGIDSAGFKRLVANYASRESVPLDRELPGTITFDEYCHFHEVVLEIDVIEDVLRKYSLGGISREDLLGETSKEELQHAIFAVTGRRLSDLQANALIEMFDSDGDKELDSNEFFNVIKSRAERGKEMRSLSDGVKKTGAFFVCIKDCIIGPS